MRVLDAPRAHRHQVAILDEDRWLAFPGGVVRSRRHPVEPVFGEESDVLLPCLGVEQLRLAIQQVLDFAPQGFVHDASPSAM
jgi:hypothetical protein